MTQSSFLDMYDSPIEEGFYIDVSQKNFMSSLHYLILQENQVKVESIYGEPFIITPSFLQSYVLIENPQVFLTQLQNATRFFESKLEKQASENKSNQNAQNPESAFLQQSEGAQRVSNLKL